MAAERERTTADPSKESVDNRSRQLDPEHDAYWRSRGEEGRPDTRRTKTDVRKKQ